MNVEHDTPSDLECIECSANIPVELIETIIKEGFVYCEKCGAKNKKEDFNIQLTPQQLDKLSPKNLREMLLTAKNKSIAYTKKKLSESFQKIKDKKKKKK